MFGGLEHQLSADGLSYVAWRGTCACGHKDEWTSDKAQAWNAAADHFLALVEIPPPARRGTNGSGA